MSWENMFDSCNGGSGYYSSAPTLYAQQCTWLLFTAHLCNDIGQVYTWFTYDLPTLD